MHPYPKETSGRQYTSPLLLPAEAESRRDQTAVTRRRPNPSNLIPVFAATLILSGNAHLARKDRGYTVNPQEAVETVLTDPDSIDVVVTDYNMPEMSGLEVARRLAAIRNTLPVILVSGYLTPEIHAAALAAHVKDIVYKPTMLRELEPTISRLLVESQQH